MVKVLLTVPSSEGCENFPEAVPVIAEIPLVLLSSEGHRKLRTTRTTVWFTVEYCQLEVGPGPWLVLPGEQIKGSNNVGEVGDKFAIKIRKPEERANTLDRGGRFPFFDSRKFNQVHFNLSLSNYHTK